MRTRVLLRGDRKFKLSLSLLLLERTSCLRDPGSFPCLLGATNRGNWCSQGSRMLCCQCKSVRSPTARDKKLCLGGLFRRMRVKCEGRDRGPADCPRVYEGSRVGQRGRRECTRERDGYVKQTCCVCASVTGRMKDEEENASKLSYLFSISFSSTAFLSDDYRKVFFLVMDTIDKLGVKTVRGKFSRVRTKLRDPT